MIPAHASQSAPLRHGCIRVSATLAVTVVMLTFAVLGHNDDTHRMPPTGETHV